MHASRCRISWGRIAWASLRRGFLEVASYRGALIGQVLSGMVSLCVLYFFAQFVDRGQPGAISHWIGAHGYLSFVLIGVTLLNWQHASVAAFSMSLRQGQLNGVLEALVLGPAPSWFVIACFPLYGFFSALGSALLFVVGGFIVGVTWHHANLVSVLTLVLLLMCCFAGFGLLGAALSLLLRRTDPLTIFLGAATALTAGVLYPRDVLPNWLQRLGDVLPLTHGLSAMRRAVLQGEGLIALRQDFYWLMAVALGSVTLGLVVFAKSISILKTRGTLGQY